MSMNRGTLADYCEGIDNAHAIAIDVETRDPQLTSLGSGARRDDADVVGVAIAACDRSWRPIWSSYFPIDHGQGPNEPREKVRRYVQDRVLAAKYIAGANLIYDIDFLDAKLGIDFELLVPGRRHYIDIQHSEALIDENKRGEYSLGAIAQHRLGKGKDEQPLYDWLAEKFGGSPTRSAQAGNIWRAPADKVLDYAISDVELPLEIYGKQRMILAGKAPDDRGQITDLSEVWLLERDLFPMVAAMKKRGVLIDVEQAHRNQAQLDAEFERAREMTESYQVRAGSAASIADYLDSAGVDYPRTANGAPSFRKEWLEAHADAERGEEYQRLFHHILVYRRLQKNKSTFIAGLLKHRSPEGRIHCAFNQLKSDEYGAVSGRFSSSNPNLQNQPSRDPVMTPMIRGTFIPDPGEIWGTADYSQIEYRLLIVEALRYLHPSTQGYKAALELKKRFIDGHARGEKVDVHEEIGNLCNIGRRDGKTINFGMVYGLGTASLQAKLGRSPEECDAVFLAYHNAAPFAKDMLTLFNKRAKKGLDVITIGGRRRRFTTVELRVPWELPDASMMPHLEPYMVHDPETGIWSRKKKAKPPMFPSEARAFEYYADAAGLDRKQVKLTRSKTHTALNADLQGGAADIMKRAMLDIYRSGVCDTLRAPLLTVHDELNWSIPQTNAGREAFSESVRIMENVYSDRIGGLPLVVDYDTGANWAECK
jgi:DNA polymerase I-like protein with 3'-5' exonuclease and polymerase domains